MFPSVPVSGLSAPSTSFVTRPLRLHLRLRLLYSACVGSSAAPSASTFAVLVPRPHFLWLVCCLCVWVVYFFCVFYASSALSASTSTSAVLYLCWVICYFVCVCVSYAYILSASSVARLCLLRLCLCLRLLLVVSALLVFLFIFTL